jgi:uncharacterized membrane protein
MKRTIGIIFLIIAQYLQSKGINVPIKETDLDTLANAAGVLLAIAGVVHDVIRRAVKWYRAKKATGQLKAV